MPKFIDQHETNQNLPPEMVILIRQRLLSAEVDEYGGRGINVFIGQQTTYCYTEAPDADAVRRSHAALGIVLGPNDVEEILVLP